MADAGCGVSEAILGRRRVTSEHYSSAKAHNSFSVLSYNILNDFYMRDDPNVEGYPESVLDERTRWKTILAELRLFDTDIICLQEISGGLKDHIISDLSRIGYQGWLEKRREFDDYIGLFVRTSSFKVLEIHEIDLSEYAAQMIKGSDAVSEAAREEVRGWTRAGVVGRLRHVTSGRSLVLATLHASWTNFTRNDTNCFELAAVLDNASKLQHAEDGLVVCGDFNIRPCDPPYELLMCDELGPRSREELGGIRPLSVNGKNLSLLEAVPELFSIKSKLQSAYFSIQGKEAEASNVWVEDGKQISTPFDYILFKPDNLQVLSVVETCPLGVIGSKRPCPPDEDFPSDHQSVCASFTWTHLRSAL